MLWELVAGANVLEYLLERDSWVDHMWFSGSAAEDGVISVSTSRLREPVPPSSHFLQPPSLQGFGDPSTSLELPSTMWHCVPIAHVICVPFAHAIHRLTQPRNVHRAKGLQAFFGTHVECGLQCIHHCGLLTPRRSMSLRTSATRPAATS